VGGYLYIRSDVKLEASNLKSVGGDLYIRSDAKLEALKSVGGDLYIESDAKLEALKSVGGYLYIDAALNDKLARQLWKHNQKRTWILTVRCSEWLLSRNGNITYKINNVVFDKDLFLKVKDGKLSPMEVFTLKNIEQRRVAYERLDKARIRELEGLKILEETTDQQGKRMEIIEFSVNGFSKPFRFLHCIDASTDREYYLERANDTDCWTAKNKSFGLPEKHRFTKEW
jgi:hypothetical protein